MLFGAEWTKSDNDCKLYQLVPVPSIVNCKTQKFKKKKKKKKKNKSWTDQLTDRKMGGLTD